MRNSSFGFLSALTIAAALCAAPLLTSSPAWAAPSAPAGTTLTPSQSDAMDKFQQQKNSSGSQGNNSTIPGSTNHGPPPNPSQPAKTVGKADMAGNTPLHLAAYQGDTAKLTELLAKPGLLVDVPEKRGLTPLMLAAGNGHPDAVKLLLDKGANPNLKSKEGTTALHRASAVGDLPTVELLLKAGADPAIVDARGRTPLQMAEHNRQGDWSAVGDRLKASQSSK